MSIKLHPLVQKTKTELLKLDKKERLNWEEQSKFSNSFLPVSVEPKLRTRALNFMNNLLLFLEVNGHTIKFKYNRCHVEMYGQLTEINLRQKYYRKRIVGTHGYSHNTYDKSEDLEFQVGSYDRKGWIDKKTIKLEDQLPKIYNYIEKKCKAWAVLRKRQKIEEEKRETQRQFEEEKTYLIAIENEKTEILIKNASNYKKALEIRIYLKALKEKSKLKLEKDNKHEEYIQWGHEKANKIDPLFNL